MTGSTGARGVTSGPGGARVAKRDLPADRNYRAVAFPSLVAELKTVDGIPPDAVEFMAVAVFIFRPPPRSVVSAWTELSNHLLKFWRLAEPQEATPATARLALELRAIGEVEVRRGQILLAQSQGQADLTAGSRRRLPRPAFDHFLVVGIEVLKAHGLKETLSFDADAREDALTVMAAVLDKVWEFEPGRRRKGRVGRADHEVRGRDVEAVRTELQRARRKRPRLLQTEDPLSVLLPLRSEARTHGTVRGQKTTWIPMVSRRHRSP